MKAIVVAALIAGFSTVQGVAGPIDLSAQTCKQFQASSPDEIKIILAWLDGYYKDEKDPPVKIPRRSSRAVVRSQAPTPAAVFSVMACRHSTSLPKVSATASSAS